MEIRTVDHVTYVAAPEIIAMDMGEIFEEKGLQYDIIDIAFMPDDIPAYYEVNDERYINDAVCIVSHMNEDDVHLLMRRLMNPFRYGEVNDP